MIRGLMTAASGILANEKQQELIANNIANAETAGYKQDDGVQGDFADMLLYRMNDHTGAGPAPSTANPVGPLGLGTTLVEAAVRFTPGPLKETGHASDFALVDGNDPQNPNRRAFFPVLAGNRVLLTRDGSFHSDGQGYLVNSRGEPLLAVNAAGQVMANTRIRLLPGASDGNSSTGILQVVDAASGQPLAAAGTLPGQAPRFAVDVQDVTRLQKTGNGDYDPAGAVLLPSNAEAREGFIEQANVDLSQTLVQMINVLRNYEANTRVVRALDQTLQKTVNDVGKV